MLWAKVEQGVGQLPSKLRETRCNYISMLKECIRTYLPWDPILAGGVYLKRYREPTALLGVFSPLPGFYRSEQDVLY